MLVVATLLFPAAMAACSGSKMSRTDPAKGVYAAEDLEQFVDDTAVDRSRLLLEPEYVLGVGDVLDVVFLFNSNLSTLGLTVRRDGRISLPYVGDQMAAGLTPMVLDSVLTEAFSEILRQPNISVIVRLTAEQKVYVLGEVARPGMYTFSDVMSIVQAVSSAGGVLKSGKGEHAVLIRRSGLNRIVGVEIDVKGIMTGENLSDDVLLRNYDVVYIPKRAIYSASEFLDVATSLLIRPADVALRGWQIATMQANYEFLRRSTTTTTTTR